MKVPSHVVMLLGLPLLTISAASLGADPLETWVQRLAGFRYLEDVTFGNSIFVAVGSYGAIFSSNDGLDWSYHQASSVYASSLYDFYGVTYGEHEFVAVGLFPIHLDSVGCVGVSTDGQKWTASPAWNFSTRSQIHAAYGNHTLVVMDWFGGSFLAYSTDFQNWTWDRSNSTYNVVYENGRFIAVGSNGLIRTSTNAIDWNVAYSGVTNALADVAYGNGMYVAVGAQGRILRSRDGNTWIPCVSPTANVLRKVAFGAGMFLAAGRPTSEVVSSTDGEVWQLHKTDLPSPPSDGFLYFHALTFGAGTFVGLIETYAPYAIVSTDIYQSGSVQVELGAQIRSDLNGIQLTARGGMERAYTLQGSTDLGDWTDLLVFTNSGPTNVFLDTSLSNAPRRFYRAVAR
jgi:hypothetical protein